MTRDTLRRRLDHLEQAPVRRPCAVKSMTDAELLELFADDVISTPAGPVRFADADEVSQWTHIKKVASGVRVVFARDTEPAPAPRMGESVVVLDEEDAYL
ncbi:hypothetical protein [Methanocalculus sp.]|uniref:hypothetical protein n=1 Tax=Methanocalculus sp. TaxID=2004547 RepID=UPI0026132B9D|nr:hypothetical protein [Methanocalculus sp.]MDG6251676.1 hypothetical protein [Methanocalculus sp.]